MTRVRIALGLVLAAGGLVLFFLGNDSDWLRWTGAGVALFGLALAFWIGAEALPLALVALAAAPASVGLASFAESSPATKIPPSHAGTSGGFSTRVTVTTPRTTARKTSSTSTRTRTRTTGTTGTTTGTTTQAPPKPPQKPKRGHPAELPRTL